MFVFFCGGCGFFFWIYGVLGRWVFLGFVFYYESCVFGGREKKGKIGFVFW